MRMHSRKSRKAPRVVVFLLLCAAGVGLWWALTVGPEPTIALETDRPAVGRATRVVADFAEPRRGLGVVRLEVVQGERTEVLDEQRFERGSGLPIVGDAGVGETTLVETIGTDSLPWLEEGEVVVRAVADRSAGPLRRGQPVAWVCLTMSCQVSRTDSTIRNRGTFAFGDSPR